MITLNKRKFPKALKIAFLFFLLFMPTYFDQLSIAGIITDIDRIIYVCLAVFLIYKHKKVSKLMWLILLYFLIIIISTCYNLQFDMSVVFYFVKIVLSCLYIDYLIQNEPYHIFETLLTVIQFLVVLDFISILLFPNGLYSVNIIINDYNNTSSAGWLLGYKNNRIMWLFLANYLSFLRLYIKYPKKIVDLRSIIILIISLCSVIMVKSSTSIIVLCMFVAYLIFYFPINKVRIFNILTYGIIYVFIWVQMILLSNVPMFSNITRLLGKDTTFSSRDLVWSNALLLIKSKLLLGYGYIDANIEKTYLGGWSFVNTHNQILEILFDGGIIAFIIFVFLILILGKKLYSFRKNKIAIFTSWTLLALFVEMLTEVLGNISLFWIVLIIMYHSLNSQLSFQREQSCQSDKL